MLNPRAQLNLKNAKSYFREHLAASEYYSEGIKSSGEWFGCGALKLGLTGCVQETAFLRLCDGRHPETNERLTQRINTDRKENGKAVSNRRVFYDFTISPTKSVSIMALCRDARIIDVHRGATLLMMSELEKFAQTRVRKGGQNTEQVTGNLVGATFLHETSRELDPHLHTHCVVLNATYDAKEKEWKALQVLDMYRAQKFAENLYYHELSKGLKKLGYELESTANGVEIKGVPKSLLQKFSKRHIQIEEEARKRISVEKSTKDVRLLKRQIARDERKRKAKHSTADDQRPQWEKQMSASEKAALDLLRKASPREFEKADVREIISWADDHLFERRSVVYDYELLSTALDHGRGKNFEIAELIQAVQQRDYHRDRFSRKLASREVLRCEIEIVLAARSGRRKFEPFNREYVGSASLSDEQRKAVNSILGSRDLITLFRGAAGTGKTFALKEIERGLVATGYSVLVLAPQRQQVLGLQKDGLAAQTLARILLTKQVPHSSVVMVDEAGQIGGSQLRELIQLVKSTDSRLILSGDTRQHGAVTASDALRAIEEYGEIKPAEIQTIRRQDPKLGRNRSERALIRSYREAVKSASTGEILKSFDQLDNLGWVRELSPDLRRETLASEYLSSLERKETALVVAQTWDEVNGVNATIRSELKKRGKLGSGEVLHTFQTLDSTLAQRRDENFYQPGNYVCFLKRYGRYARGDLCEVVQANARGITLLKEGRRSTVSFKYAERLAVAKQSEMELAAGDRLQLKFNGRSKEGALLNNGELVTVECLQKDGSILVAEESGLRKTLHPSQRLFNRGYAVTSYASQGKTVDTVLFAEANNPAATNQNQWYVAISRGRKRALVFTSDKAELRATICRPGSRELAVELNANPIESSRQRENDPAWVDRVWDNIGRIHRQNFVKACQQAREFVRNKINL